MQIHPRPAPRVFSRRAFVALLGAGAAGMLGRRADAAVGGEAPEAGVIGQSRVGEAACGPCALANALNHGDPATRRAFRELSNGSPESGVETLIARYGTKPSETYGPRRGRFSPEAGLTADDMPYLANDVLAAGKLPGVRGDYLNLVRRRGGARPPAPDSRSADGLARAGAAAGGGDPRVFRRSGRTRHGGVGESIRALARAPRRGTDDAAAARERVFLPVRGFVHGAGDSGVRVRGALPAVQRHARVFVEGRRHEGLALAVGASVRVAQRAGFAADDPVASVARTHARRADVRGASKGM